MENTFGERDSNILPKLDVSLELGMEMTQCKAGLSSWPETTGRKKRKRKHNHLTGNDMYDNHPKVTSSINTSPVQTNSFLHLPDNTCLSADLQMAQHDGEVVIYQDVGKGKEQRHNAFQCNDINQGLQESGTQPSHFLSNTEYVQRENENSVSEAAEQPDSFPKCIDTSSMKKHNDIISPEVSSTKTCQRKEQIRTYGRKRKNLSDSEVSSLGSIKDDAGSSELVVQDSSVRDTAFNERNVVKGVSGLDPSAKDMQWGNSDELHGIHYAMEDAYTVKERLHNCTAFHKEDKVSDEASGSDPSVGNSESDNLGIHRKMKDEISSEMGVMTDDVSLPIIRKDGSQQILLSSLEGAATENFRKKLLVLDVNGLLADIVLCPSERYKPDATISGKAVFKRPFCDDFLQFCFESFHVGVWSSRIKKNVNSVLDFLMGKLKRNLLFCWDQSHCTDTGFNTVENRDKPLVLKELKKLWDNHEPGLPWERGEYNESNTLLLDDSPYKALRNPPHTAIFPRTYWYKDAKDNSLGPDGDLRVYLKGLASADNVQKYVELNPFGQRPITKANLSWAFYLKVIGTTSSQQEEEGNNSSARQQDATHFSGVGGGKSAGGGMSSRQLIDSVEMSCPGALDLNVRGMDLDSRLPLPVNAVNGQGVVFDGQLLVEAPKPNIEDMDFESRLSLPVNAPNGQGVGFDGGLLADAANQNGRGMAFDSHLPHPVDAPNGPGVGFDGKLQADAPNQNGQGVGFDGKLQADAPNQNGQGVSFDGPQVAAPKPNERGLGFDGQPLVDAPKPNEQGVGFDGRLQVDAAVRPRPPHETLPLPTYASSTLYVEGLPPNSSRREVAHIFRPFVGYKDVRLVRKERSSSSFPYILGFVEFVNPECAAAALSSLQGYKVDEHDPRSPYLRLQFSKNSRQRSGSASRWNW